MKTAITIGTEHRTGKTVLIAGEEVPMAAQIDSFKKEFALSKDHPQFRAVKVIEIATFNVLKKSNVLSVTEVKEILPKEKQSTKKKSPL